MIKEILEQDKKQNIARKILEALPEWFGIEEDREEYIRNSKKQPFFSYYESNKPVGFICLKINSKDTIEIAVIGILKEYQRKGIGKQLFLKAKEHAMQMGFSFMQVKTVQKGYYKQYDNTNQFYINLGFKEFEVFPNLWNEKNPCQIYVMSLK